jgi:hypothetical protein
MRRIFLDTEFTDLPWSGHSELLWVGLADQDGRSWSAVNAEVSTDAHFSEFVRDVVVPLIPADEPRLWPQGAVYRHRGGTTPTLHELGRGPTVAEMAQRDDLSTERVRELLRIIDYTVPVGEQDEFIWEPRAES